MSGLRRRVKRARTRDERLSGFKAGKRLSMLIPTEGGESFPTKARRFARLVHLRNAGVRGDLGELPAPKGTTK